MIEKILKGIENVIVALYWMFIGWWVAIIKYVINKRNSKFESKSINPLGNKPYKTDIKVNQKDIYINSNPVSNKKYSSKSLMTINEQYFYNIINKAFSDKYIIMPQVNLASILNKEKQFKNEYQNELFRNIDFGIFDKETTSPLLLIEINDKSHNEKKRQYRDIKVKEILNNANIKLITFYTNYPNEENYVINRIKENLK